MNNIKLIPGSIFKHYKNKLYLIENVAIHTETMEEMVVYRQLYKKQLGAQFNDFQIWTRPKDMFLSTVHIDGKNIPRFELVE